MNKKELEQIEEKLRLEKEQQRKELISQTSTGDFSPTSVRLSPELKSKAKQLAFKKYNKTEVSHLLKDLLLKALKEEGLL